MTDAERKRVADEWRIPMEQVRVPSEMTPVQLNSVAFNYGAVYTRSDSHAYAIMPDGLRVGRRVRIDRIGMM
jgi:hypothetical protein